MDKTCNTCQRWYKGRCLAMKAPQDNCWAWTDDPNWEEEYKAALKKYRDVKNLGSYYFNRDKPNEFRAWRQYNNASQSDKNGSNFD